MKSKLRLLVLVWAGLWPFAHWALVAQYDINPWKLGGWAMYASPKPPVMVAAFREADGSLQVLDERAFAEPAREALERFRIRRHALGKLVEPEEPARAILAEQAALPKVTILVQTYYLSTESARMRSTIDRYSYDR